MSEKTEEELRESVRKYQQELEKGYIKNTYINRDVFVDVLLFKEPVEDYDSNYIKATLPKVKLERATKSRQKYEFNSYRELLRTFEEFEEDFKKQGGEEYFTKASEGEIEVKIIQPIIRMMGFTYKAKESIKIHGIVNHLDFVLFPNESMQREYEDNNQKFKTIVGDIEKDNVVILEAKSLKQDFQKGRATATPERQLLNYLNLTKVKRGILTNGKQWWIYDVGNISKTVQIIGIDLFSILNKESELTLRDFHNIFKAENFYGDNFFNNLNQKNQEKTLELENNLKETIYGEQSVLESIGVKIYQANKGEDAKVIYHNALVMLFRLIFMLFYENKYFDYLSKHRSYKMYSLVDLHRDLKESKESKPTYEDLLTIWNYLDKGDYKHKIPMLNGGLFAKAEAELINNKYLFNSEELIGILDSLTNNNDYKNLDVKQLGNIYEGLLAYEFKIANHNLSFVSYQEGAKTIYTFLDHYNLEFYKKEGKSVNIIKEYDKNDLYLTSLSNQRKTTASYYTPSVLTDFMVKEAIDTQLKQEGMGILDLKIIDNSCGSGHFLVSALNYLSSLCETNEEYYEQIKAELEKEKEQIKSNIKKVTTNEEEVAMLFPEDRQIIKRLLLKKTIYGVDLNKIAIEITKISLWIETFIFGTPLSFIEHHIKCGNSLIYSTLEDFKDFEDKYLKTDMFGEDILIIEVLEEAYRQITSLNDTTKEDIEKSKKSYEDLKQPLEEVNSYLNFLNYYTFKKINKQHFAKQKDEAESSYDIDEIAKWQAYEVKNPLDEFISFANKPSKNFENFINNYQPFNIEVEFPDVKAFNVIVGNPPWDKSKFSEEEFFATYQSNYRTLKHQAKKVVKERLFSSAEGIKKEYNNKQNFIITLNNYYKNKFPHNKGSGDNNMFQFFLERNLNLLSAKGSLYYLTPSIWIFADSAINIRKYIFNNFSLNQLFCFQNNNKLFDIAQNYKFCLYHIQKGSPTTSFACFFLESKTERLYQKETHSNLSLSEIQAYSKEELAILELNNPTIKNITFKAYNLFTTIDESYIQFRNELHMTKHKSLMEETEQKNYIKMFEGKCIEQFNSNFAKITYFVNPQKLPKQNQYKHYRLAFRNIASNTNQRTLIASLLPKNSTFSHSLTASIVREDSSIYKLLFCQAIFNSLMADFILRLYVDMNVSLTYLRRLPMPQPQDNEIFANPIYAKLLYNSALLSYLHSREDFKYFVTEFNFNNPQSYCSRITSFNLNNTTLNGCNFNTFNSKFNNSLNNSNTSNREELITSNFSSNDFNSNFKNTANNNYHNEELTINATYKDGVAINNLNPTQSYNSPNNEESELISNRTESTLTFNSVAKLIEQNSYAKLKDYPTTQQSQERFINELKIENDILTFALYQLKVEEIEEILNSFKVLKNKNPQYLARLREKIKSL